MQNLKIVRWFFLLCLCFPGRLSACWDSTKPVEIPAGNVRVRITFAAEPAKLAVVMLGNRQSGESAQFSVDRKGWVKFPKALRGEYKLIIDGPSHDSFEVIAGPLFPAQRASSLVYFSFSIGGCTQVRILEDHTEPTF